MDFNGRLKSRLCIGIAKPYLGVNKHLFQNGRLLLTCMNISLYNILYQENIIL